MRVKALAIGLMAALAAARSGTALAAGNDVVIGDIDDLSGLYADIQGTAAVEAVKMAIADFGGTVLDRKTPGTTTKL
jgi:branched-chain amino acid transport system substrate-binding protein